MTSEFLILNTEIEERLRIRRFLLDLFQTEREIKPLLRLNAIFAANFSIMMNDCWKSPELEVGRQACWIDDLMNGAVETKVGRISEQANQRIVDIPGIVGAFFIIAGVRRPSQDVISENVIALY